MDIVLLINFDMYGAVVRKLEMVVLPDTHITVSSAYIWTHDVIRTYSILLCEEKTLVSLGKIE